MSTCLDRRLPSFRLCHFQPVLLSILLLSSTAKSLSAEDILQDYNSDGKISVTAFGDSITYGVGDGTQPGANIDHAPYPDGPAGYPSILETIMRLPINNRGNPGEMLTETGVARFPSVVRGQDDDVVLIMEGTNDAGVQVDHNDFSHSLQKVINVALASGKYPVLMTLPPPCCNHSGPRPFNIALSKIIAEKSHVNELPLADIKLAWDTTCENKECELYNLPEGLHPNALGYKVMAQTVAATLLGIDIFKPGGAKELEDALGLEAGEVVVKPEITPSTPAAQ